MQCNGEISSHRKNGQIFGIKQFTTRKFCSRKCSAIAHKKPQEIILYENYGEVVAKNIHRKEKGRIKFDLPDLELVKNYHWSIDSSGYAQTDSKDGKRVRLHALLLGVRKKGCVVDHANGISTDNRRANLRFITIRENILNSKLSKRNTSGHRGLSRDSRGMWTTRIKFQGQSIHLGNFIDRDFAISVIKRAEQVFYPDMLGRKLE